VSALFQRGGLKNRRQGLTFKQTFDINKRKIKTSVVLCQEFRHMPVPDDPQIRLLEAAGRTFAEKGFEGATVREICKAAGANIAAVNYYFRDKERLYIEAVKHATCGAVGRPHLPAWGADTPPAIKLRDFIRMVVARMMTKDRPAWNMQLIMREMAQPTSACAEVVREFVQPLSEILHGILMEILPARTPPWKRYLTAFSIVGQCLYHVQNKPIAALLAGEHYRHFTPDVVAEHVTHFTLAALGLGPAVGREQAGLAEVPETV
jgi:AcrR family transcriptional regulator